MTDGVIFRSPCRGVKLPAEDLSPVIPLTTEQVLGLIDVIPERYRALTIAAAATGLRQGEVLGLTVEHLDFLRRQLRVEQQMKHLAPRPPFLARPKTPSSVRTVPLPDVALETLPSTSAAGRRRRRCGRSPDATNCWCSPPAEVDGNGGHVQQTWRKAVKAAELPDGAGFHALRHYYASLLIARGASVKVVQARLGHKSALETLDTYGHLWHGSEDQTRRAVDEALGTLAASSRPAKWFAGPLTCADASDHQYPAYWSDPLTCANAPIYQYSS